MKKRFFRTAAVVPILLLVAACSSPAGDGVANDDPGEMTTLKVGLVPITAVAPIYIGMEQGFFEEEGIELELTMGMGGPSAVAGVESGSVDIAISDSVAMIRTAATGINLTSLINAGAVDENGVGGSQVVVAADSDITSVGDLEGKTIGIFNLQSTNELNVRAAIDAEGGDSSTLSFVSLEFTAMLAALQRGDIDAAGMAEPNLSLALDAGEVRTVLDYYPIVFPSGTSITLWFTGTKQLDSKLESIEGFVTAMEKAAKYSDENPDEVRAIIPSYSGLSAEMLTDVPLQKYSAPLTPADFDKSTELLKKYGGLVETPDMSDLIWK